MALVSGLRDQLLTIGAIWLVHHGIFRGLRFADSNVNRLNLLLLMAIRFLAISHQADGRCDRLE